MARIDLHIKNNSKYAELLTKKAGKDKSYRQYLTKTGAVKRGGFTMLKEKQCQLTTK